MGGLTLDRVLHPIRSPTTLTGDSDERPAAVTNDRIVLLALVGFALAVLASAGWCALHTAWSEEPAAWWLAVRWGMATWAGWTLAWALAQTRRRHGPMSSVKAALVAATMAGAVFAGEVLLRALLLVPLPGEGVLYLLYGRVPLLATGAVGIFVLLHQSHSGTARASGCTTAEPYTQSASTDVGCFLEATQAPPHAPYLLAASVGTRRVAVAVADVLWLSAEENYVALHLHDGRNALLRGTLTALAAQLAGHGFVRIHRRFVVRRQAVREAGATKLRLSDGTALPIGRRYRDALRTVAARISDQCPCFGRASTLASELSSQASPDGERADIAFPASHAGSTAALQQHRPGSGIAGGVSS